MLSCSQVLLPLISIPYVTRVLLPEGIGHVNFIDSLSYYFVTIAEFGIVVYGIREVGRTQHDREKLQRLVSELVVLHCITSTISLLAYSICVYLLWQKIQDLRLIFFSVSFLLANFFACEWYFWGLERFKYITIRSLISRILAVVSIFILVKQPPDYYIYYGIIVITTMINLVSNTVLLFKQLPFTLKKLNLRRHLRYTSITWLISLFYCVIIMLDNVLLGMVSTAAAVGIYAFSIKIVRLSSNLLTDMFLVLYPRTIMLIKEQKTNEVQQMIMKSVQLIILLSVPACLAVFLLSEPLVKIFFGKNFQSVRTNLKILSIFPFARAYGMFLSKQILISYDKEKLYLYSLMTGSLFFVITTLILSSRLHDLGACYAIVLTEILVMVINYYYVKKTVPGLKVFDWRILLQAIGGAIVFIPVIRIISVYVESDLLVLILSAAVCIPVYFLFQIFVCKNRLLVTIKHCMQRSGNHTFFIQEYLHQEVFHGGIGAVDIERILLTLHYTPVFFPFHYDFSVKAKLGRLLFLVKTVMSIPAGSVVVFQFPLHAGMHELLLRLLRWRKSIRLICFILDIDGLKDGNATLLQQEISRLKKYHSFIVHNKSMKNWLDQHVPQNRSSMIEFFDFLTTPSAVTRQWNNTVVFAGNLEKSGFINHLQKWATACAHTTLYLYGPGFTPASPLPGNIIYKGILEPYSLPTVLEGAFGLVWDGESIEGSGGSLGDYMRYISHHKLSLYIVSGLPVITAGWAASAELVHRYRIGFTVNSLLEIESKIAAVSPEEYMQMSNNTRLLAQRITRGQNLMQALNELLQ